MIKENEEKLIEIFNAVLDLGDNFEANLLSKKLEKQLSVHV